MNAIKDEVIDSLLQFRRESFALRSAHRALLLVSFRLFWLFLVDAIIVANLEHACANRYLPAHDDAFCHALDVVLLALNG